MTYGDSMGIEEVTTLEAISSGDSVIHNLEGRVKLISILLIIVFTVFSDRLIVPLVMEIFLLVVMYLAELSFKESFKRILLLLPFGGFVIAFQPFIHPGNVEEIMNQLDVAERQIEQNGNAKVIFFDLCLQMIVLIKKPRP